MRRAHAARFAMLVDAAPYYGALRASLLAARERVFIVGWDVDSRTPLCDAGEPDDDAPRELGPLLRHLVERRPSLRIDVLLWDFALLYALEREPLPRLNLDWRTPKQVRVVLDNRLPPGACHHQKLVVIDDSVAYCGGLDLTIRRWDTPAHRLHEPMRCDPDGKPYEPFHDVQVAVDGEAARALGEVARDRLYRLGYRRPPDAQPNAHAWPDGLAADIEEVDLAIPLTLPPENDQPALRETEEVFLRAIGAAQTFVFVENQYFASRRLTDAVAQRMRECDGLRLLVVSPEKPHGWLEENTMGAARERCLRLLEEAGVGERACFVWPQVCEDGGRAAVMVHSKVLIVDDAFAYIGSANFNNRSLRLDSECGLAIEADSNAQRTGIAALRRRLLAEHVDCPPEDFAALEREHDDLVSCVRACNPQRRRLRPLEPMGLDEAQLARVLSKLADPEQPLLPAVTINMFDATRAGRWRRLWLRLRALPRWARRRLRRRI